MSKELEELKNNVDIKKALKFAQTCGYHADVQYALEKAVKLEQALTPPTAEQLCEEIARELDHDKIIYFDNRFYFYNDKDYYNIANQIKLDWLASKGKYSLTKRIAMFYEKEAKE